MGAAPAELGRDADLAPRRVSLGGAQAALAGGAGRPDAPLS
jgi:hypothetical protein